MSSINEYTSSLHQGFFFMMYLVPQYMHAIGFSGVMVLSWMYSIGCPKTPPPPSHTAEVPFISTTGNAETHCSASLRCLFPVPPMTIMVLKHLERYLLPVASVTAALVENPWTWTIGAWRQRRGVERENGTNRTPVLSSCFLSCNAHLFVAIISSATLLRNLGSACSPKKATEPRTSKKGLLYSNHSHNHNSCYVDWMIYFQCIMHIT